MCNMEKTLLQNFSRDYKNILIDEIALNGLEGICLDLLWKYVEKRFDAPLTIKLKSRYWRYLSNCKNLEFYKLPAPVLHIDIYDRFSYVDEERAIFKNPEIDLEGPYEYRPVKGDYGSCLNSEERELMPNEIIAKLSYESVQEQYGNKLVIVASLEERWHALVPHLSIMHLSLLNPMQYCFLELLGKSRENGQVTVGHSHLFKIVKEPKFLFYVRLALTRMDFLKATYISQMTGGKAVRAQLIRLKRFYKPISVSMAKIQKQKGAIDYLKAQPGFTGYVEDMINKGVLKMPDVRLLKKKFNYFLFSDKKVPTETKKKRKSCLDKMVTLTPMNDSASESEEDPEVAEQKCQYKVGIPLLRQSYDLFLSVGLKGLTQTDLSQKLGVEFYTSRTICRVLKSRHLIREYLEDRGRQRTAKFIAVAARNESELQYEEEEKKYQSYLSKSLVTSDNTDGSPPLKKIKIEKDNNPNNDFDFVNQIEETNELEGISKKDIASLRKSTKVFTLRQLKYANSIIKIIQERKCVSGYQTLAKIASELINETILDTKALKKLVMKLAHEKQLKIFKMKWPNRMEIDRYSVLFCSPELERTDPLIKAKYKEICIRSVTLKGIAKEVPIPTETNNFVTHYAYPRYMKIQKLHEFLIQLAYFNEEKTDPLAPKGMVSLVTILSEITLELALGNLKKLTLTEIYSLKIDEKSLKLKLPQCGPNVHAVLYRMKNIDATIRGSLKVLATLGLIQMVDEPSKTKDQNSHLACCIIYVNRHAKIINTTGVWPRASSFGGKLELLFTFNSPEDVKCFWEKVFTISTNTSVKGVRDSKKTYAFTIPRKNKSLVYEHDPSVPLGDGNGPCGYDSGIFMDMIRNWHTYVVRKKQVIKPSIVQKVVPQHSKKKVIKKKKIKLAPERNTSLIRKARLPRCGVVEDLGGDTSRRIRRYIDNSIKWSLEEDRVVVMCRAAMSIMAPTTQAGSLTVTNSVVKDILTFKDPRKIAFFCHARAALLDNNYERCYEKNSIINEMKRRKHLIKKYENCLKILRIKNTGSNTSYIREARLRMMELVWIIYQVVKSDSFNNKTPCVASSYQEFKENYKITTSTGVPTPYEKYTTPESEVELATLKEGVMSAVVFSAERRVGMASRIYSVLKKYPEPMLRTAVDELRKCGAIVIFKSCTSAVRTHFREMVQSAYRTSSVYYRRAVLRFTVDLIDHLYDELCNETPRDNIKGSPCTNCIMLESLTSGLIDVYLTTDAAVSCPLNTILQEEQLTTDEEMKYKLRAGVMGWRTDKNIKTLRDDIGDKIQLDDVLNSIRRHAVLIFDYVEPIPEIENEIVSYVKNKGQSGAKYSELCKLTSYSESELIENLRDLVRQGVLYKVGYRENILIHPEYIKYWALDLEKCFIIPCQWVTVDLIVKHDVILKWMSSVVYKLFSSPGHTLASLAESCEYLNASNVQMICNVLRDFKCVYYKIQETPEPSLFSDDDEMPVTKEYHEFESMFKVFVFPECDMLTKFSVLKTIVCRSEVNPEKRS